MWPFLQTVLEKHGLSSVISIAVIGCFAVAIRYLWQHSVQLQKTLAEREKAHAEAIAVQEAKHEADLRYVTEQFAKRIEAIQEMRVADLRGLVERGTESVVRTQLAAESMTKSMDALSRAVQERS